MLLLKNADVISETEIKRRDVMINGGVIEQLGEDLSCEGSDIIDLDGLFLSPGLIDLHCHGGGGFSAMGDVGDVLGTAQAHLKNGVTSILPTSLAAPLDVLDTAVGNIRRAMKENRGILGAHLEGPFLSPEMCGAQNAENLAIPSETDYRDFFERNCDTVKMVGIAPELDGAYELSEFLKSRGITVSLAHSAGYADTAAEALKHGFTDITHIFNACTSCVRDGALKRAGTAEAGLTDDRFSVQAIADLIHLPPELLELIYRCKGADKMYLISDGLEFSASDIEEGESVTQRNGVRAVVRNGAMLTEDLSKLAGSMASGIQLVKNMYESTSASLPEVIKMMSLTPARVIGADSHKGRIERGFDSDVIAFDRDFNIKYVICDGELLHKA